MRLAASACFRWKVVKSKIKKMLFAAFETSKWMLSPSANKQMIMKIEKRENALTNAHSHNTNKCSCGWTFAHIARLFFDVHFLSLFARFYICLYICWCTQKPIKWTWTCDAIVLANGKMYRIHQLDLQPNKPTTPFQIISFVIQPYF